MRLLVYGYALESKGSGESAHYLHLRELLLRGHTVRHLTSRDYPTVGLEGLGSYEQLRVGPKARSRLINHFVGPSSAMTSHAYDRTFRAPRLNAAVRREVRRSRARDGHDHFLVLGARVTGMNEGETDVWWPQGPPGVEARTFLDSRNDYKDWMRRGRWFVLSAYHAARWLARRRQVMPARWIVAASDWSVTRFAEWADLPAVAIPYAVDLENFRPPADHRQRRRLTALHVGRLDPRKNLGGLLRAWAIVVESEPEARLELIGTAGYAPEVTRLLSDAQRVAWQGSAARDEVIRSMQSASVLVQPSIGENFGTALAEGLACGMTCVTGPDNGTNPYLDERSITAKTYAPAEIAAAILSAFDRVKVEPDVCADSARRAALAHFDARRVVDRLESLLR